MKNTILLLVFAFGLIHGNAQENYKTYCNPIDLGYTYMIYNSHNDLSYRSGADPAVVEFQEEYYMFVTRSMGYWHSKDLNNWKFIKPKQWYFQGSNAPAAHNYKDSLLYVAGNPSGSMSVLFTDEPEKGEWEATPGILHNLQDPDLFIDDDGQAYMYWGSSNKFPIRGRKLDREKRFRPAKEEHELFNLEPEKYGWHRFGENNSDAIAGYLEGAWMTKNKDIYYLTFAAPGTEFNVYGDGSYVSENPLGPFEYMPNSPFSFKPGGFINGMGHGSTVTGPNETYWHFATMAVGVNVNWERRIGMFQTFFDAEGLMHSDTYFGDYPHFVPTSKEKRGEFAGWMLLSYKKPVSVSSTFKDPEGKTDFSAENITDEYIKSFWIAAKNNDEQWVEIDLENQVEVYAFQINYNDYKSDMYGKLPNLYHQYVIEASADGTTWETIIDKSENKEDVPNDYVELPKPVKTRYIRYKNGHVPTPYLSISGLRVFGKGSGKAPGEVKGFKVERQKDRRDAQLSWNAIKGAQGYNIFWGIAKDKLYNTWLVYDKNELEMKNLSTDQSYYFAIEAFNENGVSKRINPLKIN
ncbi:MAG TPA: 1,4-beta-xylanase [Leeuwenhoekiella sp.]|nr:1,4-beta-xylanase [Leeuwenhoekiella sp.]